MGILKKSQVGKVLDTDGERWVIEAGTSVQASLKPLKVKLRKSERETEAEEEHFNGGEGYCITPRAKEARMQKQLICPAAPRKRRLAFKCRSNVFVKYFVPPSDLETVFIRRD